MFTTKADTPPPAYSPSEDIKQTQQTDTAMDIVPVGTAINSNVTPVTYQVRKNMERRGNSFLIFMEN